MFWNNGAMKQWNNRTIMLIKTSDSKLVKSFLSKLSLPKPNSHKGQNGRVLIIGGSSLFHSASLWAAEVASHFCDMVHYSSTEENQKIFLPTIFLEKTFFGGAGFPIPTFGQIDRSGFSKKIKLPGQKGYILIQL